MGGNGTVKYCYQYLSLNCNLKFWYSMLNERELDIQKLTTTNPILLAVKNLFLNCKLVKFHAEFAEKRLDY